MEFRSPASSLPILIPHSRTRLRNLTTAHIADGELLLFSWFTLC
jgi:hypothetical protein